MRKQENKNMAEMHKYKIKVNVNMYGPLPMAYMEIFKKELEEVIEEFFDKSPDAVVESFDRANVVIEEEAKE